MTVELRLPSGLIESREVVSVVFVFTCKNSECPQKEFRTPDPRKEYCSYECQDHAKYRRSCMK